VLNFKDHRIASGVRPKAVNDNDLSGLKTVFGWAARNDKLPSNPAAGLTIKVGKRTKLRSLSFTDAEALAIVSAASQVQRDREQPQTAAAKRWVPWLCAYTGARVGEMAQLRKQDVRREGDLWVLTVTPDAGTVKTDEAREIVLHPHLIEQGFPEFVAKSRPGHLFVRPAKDGDVLGPLKGLKNRLQEFARAIVPDRRVDPNHGWRHRFRTAGMDAGIDTRILSAIDGHVEPGIAAKYGHVTLSAQATAINRVPRIAVT
jgi:integrase